MGYEQATAEEFSKVEDALEALVEGRVVIVVDDEQRENEGDFIAAADRVTPETIAFMITHGQPDRAVGLILDEIRKTLMGSAGFEGGVYIYEAAELSETDYIPTPAQGMIKLHLISSCRFCISFNFVF